MQNGTVYGFEGEIGGWSNYQTLTISENLPYSTELVIVMVVVVAVAVGLLVYFKKRKR
jgi:hypothetical protein